jgi:hypothetical protein
MQFPQINLNGADAQSLAEQYHMAALAVEAALRSTYGIVHGRDYQTLPKGHLIRAIREMESRQELLRKVAEDFHLLTEHCMSDDFYTCEHCGRSHTNEFSRTCGSCDTERESGDLDLDEITFFKTGSAQLEWDVLFDSVEENKNV